MERKATNRHVSLKMVGEVEMSRDWFRSVFIVNLNIPKMFAETIAQSAARFADVDQIGKMNGKWSEMVTVRLGPEIFVRIGDERTSPTSYARTFEYAGLMIRFHCTFN